jgi:hypothetical protein
MTHDPSRRLATAEEIMNGKNPFERVSTPLGEMERWRAEAMLIGTTGGIQSVYDTIRSDTASQAARADAEQARTALTAHLCDQITELAGRFDALEARLAEAEDKRRADEARKATFDEEPLVLPPDIFEYQASAPPSEIGDDTPPPGGELHAIAAKEEPSLEDADNVGDLPKELEEPVDPVPEPRGGVYPQPTAISLNKE